MSIYATIQELKKLKKLYRKEASKFCHGAFKKYSIFEYNVIEVCPVILGINKRIELTLECKSHTHNVHISSLNDLEDYDFHTNKEKCIHEIEIKNQSEVEKAKRLLENKTEDFNNFKKLIEEFIDAVK